MGYFASGWPKIYRLPSSPSPQSAATSSPTAAADPQNHVPSPSQSNTPPPPEPAVAIAVDPTGSLLASVTASALHIWSARHHRVLRGRFTIGPTTHARHGPLVSAAWRPVADGRSPVLAAAFRSGRLILLDVAAAPLRDRRGERGMLDFAVSDAREHLAPPDVVHPLVLRVVAEAWVGGGTGAAGTGADAAVTCLAAAPAGALVGTSAGHLACVAWKDAAVVWRTHVPELLRNQDAVRKLGVLEPAEDGPVAEILAARGADDGGGVVAIAYDATLAYCGVVLGNGCALLLSMRKQGAAPPSAVEGRWLRDCGAASVTIEPRRMLATVGLRNGDVEQFYIGVPAGDICPVMRRLSLSSWYFEPTDVGAASVVSWTRDGGALLVGWEKRGLAVWSVSGCRLMWTLPQVGGILPSTPSAKASRAGESDQAKAPQRSASGAPFNYPMEQGVVASAWGPEGLFLWATPRITDSSPRAVRECHFMEFSFFRSTTGASSCQSEASRLAMFGPDRILLLASSDGYVPNSGSGPNVFGSTAARRHGPAGRGTASPRAVGRDVSDVEHAWQHVMIPQDYLWRNWPPTRIAVNDDATYVAVAGTYGVSICSVRSQRWRVFGDLSHDSRRLKCCALAWAGSSVVIGNEVEKFSRSGIPAQSSFELLVFPRDQFESSAVQARRALPTRPIIIDVRADGYLLVICEDSSVALFKMRETRGGSSVDLGEIYQVFLPTREARAAVAPSPPTTPRGDRSFEDLPLPPPGGGISVARIFPPLDHAALDGKEAPVPTQIMLLRSTGSLIMLDVRNMLSVPLLRYVEHFWYTSSQDAPFASKAHRPVWWAYGDDGTHVCFRDGMQRFLPSSVEEEVSSSEELDVAGAERLAAMSPLSKTVPVSLRMSASSRSSGIGVEQWFELDPEVYPLGIMTKQGMLVGASQGLLANSVAMNGYEMPSHTIQVKRQPVLHTLLRHMLLKPESDDRLALQVALKCSDQSQFVDSLEWLLYEAVMEYDGETVTTADAKSGREIDRGMAKNGSRDGVSGASGAHGFPASPRRVLAGSVLFPRVIRMLKYFGQYEDIVVRCARKMDAKRWPLLFSLVGDPLALLEQCLKTNRLQTAACLLVILQEMWGFASSTPQSIRLVGAALDRGEISLAGDLANFLSKAARAGMLDASQLEVAEDVAWIAESALGPRGGPSTPTAGARRRSSGSSSDGEASGRIPAVDLAVLKYAEQLLASMEVRKLAALSIRMDFPLAAWLKRKVASSEDGDGGGICTDEFAATLLKLHRLFQYPAPTGRAVRRAVERLYIPVPDGPMNGDWSSGPSSDGGEKPNGRSNGHAMENGDLADSHGPPVPPPLSIRDGSATRAVVMTSSGSEKTVGEDESEGEAVASGEKWRTQKVQSPRAFAAHSHMKMAGTGADNLFGSELPPPPSSNESEQLMGMRAKARHLCQQELIYLLSVAQQAGARELELLFGLLLLDMGAIVDALGEARKREKLQGRMVEALRGYDVEGYDALADAVEAYFADDEDDSLGKLGNQSGEADGSRTLQSNGNGVSEDGIGFVETVSAEDL